jgi:Escherichia/Staphylococcus phage prohead protease
MQHMTKAATVTDTTTDRGEFEAVVSTYDVDRQGDVVARGAFSKTLADWNAAGRMIPLHWDHSSEPEDIVGYVDPASMEESKAGLTVQGKVDLETERGREAWRLLKANSVGFSFGYLATKTHDRDDGVRVLDEIDIFEVTITPSPANNRTRVLGLKSSGNDPSTGTATAEFKIHRAATARADAAHERQRTDRELEELLAEIEARRAKEEKRNRPIQIKSFEV